MIKLIVHPGHSKCGSTSIQQSLLKNRKQLEKKGFFFPDGNFKFSFEKECNLKDDTPRRYFRHFHIAKSPEELASLINSFSEKLDYLIDNADRLGIKTVIISAENLINKLGSPFGVRLHRLLAEKFPDKRVIYFLRPQDDFIASAWQQWGHKEGVGFEEYLNRSIRNNSPNFLNICKTLSRIYKKENLVVYPLSKAKEEGGLVPLFYRSMDIDMGNLNMEDKRLNETLNPYLCEILADIDGIYKNIHDHAAKKRLIDIVGKESIFTENDKAFFSDTLRQRTRKHFRADNEVLCEQYLVSADVDNIFGAVDVVNPVSASKEEQHARMLKSLLTALLAKDV